MSYWLILLGTMAISLYASWRVRRAYSRYSQMPASSGYTGARIAQRILDINGIRDVTIHSQEGHLTDHYDPAHKRLVLSDENYHGTSVAALGVAAHEAGHAIQHHALYAPLQWRMAAVGITGIASQIGLWLPMIAMAIGLITAQTGFLLICAAMGIVMLFQLITLPVEFDATRRAKAILAQTGALHPGDETAGMNKVLDAAALTYVAAFIGSLMSFAWYLMQFLGARREE
jgi:Zn-dependent membrane protease YugP